MDHAVLYGIDTQKSLLTVHPFATGLAAALSHGLTIGIGNFAGTIDLVPETMKQASLKMRIKADSLTVNEQMKEGDRREIERVMRDEVLRISEHSEVVFESSYIRVTPLSGQLYQADITGKLSLTGVTRDHSFSAQVVIGSNGLRANGTFKIKQTDFGIPLITAGGGLLKLHDELKL